ncbi:MAG: excinuclease ABC subunit UvrC [Firmicutes bacterium]|nr:excinuclease ABC subunit UvrC [Bacillota bacterium]
MNQIIKQKLETLPELPGSYQMLDSNKNIIYVGKAKNLKSRVKSYFIGSHDQKTQTLVSNIEDFTYLITQTELDAFLLELSLIKEHSPKYNIMLMDDKSYPYIEITNELHPKIVITRKVTKKSKNIFGPFPDSYSARMTLNLLNRIFPMRKCFNLPKKVCLYYHIGQCIGPCVYPVSNDTYQGMIDKIKRFLNGNNQELLQDVKEKMLSHSLNLEYEKAKEYKDLMDSILKTTQQQQVIFKDLVDRDVFGYHQYDQFLAITILFMRQGKIIFSEASIFSFFDVAEESFIRFIIKFYETHPIPKEILLPRESDYTLLEQVINHKVISPARGSKANLIKMAKENASVHLQNNLDVYLKKHAKTIGAVDELAALLGITPPRRIEAFDNSNTMGTNPVSAMIVFSNGLPEKKEYRKFIVKTVIGADDYHTMQEVLYRRFQRMLMENTIWPDLIIMDGGIIQVHAAKAILDSLYLDIPIIGLKKDSNHKTDAIIDLNEQELKLDRHSNLYILLTKIQDEAHRFAISFHRNVQSKQIYASILDAIPKIGSVSKQKLLEKYKTIENIKMASAEELQTLGIAKDAIVNLKIALENYK